MRFLVILTPWLVPMTSIYITKRIYEKCHAIQEAYQYFFSKIRTPRLENLYIFNIKTLTLSLTSEESVHQSETLPLQFVNERNFWRQFYEKVSRRHKVSNIWAWHIFSAKFRIFYHNVGCIGGKLYCAQSRSKTLPFKTKNFSFLEATLFFRILEGLDCGISPNCSHQRATTRFSLEF